MALLGAGSLSAVLLSQLALADGGGAALSRSSAQRAAIASAGSPAAPATRPRRHTTDPASRAQPAVPVTGASHQDDGRWHREHEDD
ncbi:MAG: hypothetical protein ACXVRX_15155 [Solirubrobacteraceae bacterium]